MVKKLSIENFFLIVALFFGFIYVFLLPPFQSVDEASHFYRSYEILSGQPIAQKNQNGYAGAYLPASLEKLASEYSYLVKNIYKRTSFNQILDSSIIKLENNRTTFIEFQNTALYSPICYIPQLPGMYIARAINSNPLFIFYAGRLSNLMFFCLIIYFAIRLMPFYKLPMALLALMPMTLSLAAALTADVIVIGANFLWIALILNILDKKKEVSNLKIASLILLVFIITVSKYYFMLIPLIFLLPKSNFKNKLKYSICMFGALAVSALGIIFWESFIKNLSLDMNAAANAALQFKFIFTHPFSYFLILLKTLIIKTPRIIITMIGVLGWQDTRLDFMTYMLYPILIFLSIILDNKADFKLKKWQLYLISVDIIFSIGLIFTNLYLMWTNVGYGIVLGLNGKYFIPLVLPILLLLHNRFKINFKDEDTIKLFVLFILILILISSDLSLFHRFYGLTPNLYYEV